MSNESQKGPGAPVGCIDGFGFWRRGLCISCAPLRGMMQSFDVAFPSYDRNVCVECGTVCSHPIEDFVLLPNAELTDAHKNAP